MDAKKPTGRPSGHCRGHNRTRRVSLAFYRYTSSVARRKPTKEQRNTSYRPPFSGGQTQLESEYRQIHARWIQRLLANPPKDVPSVAPTLRCAICKVAISIHKRERDYFDHEIEPSTVDPSRCKTCRATTEVHQRYAHDPEPYLDDDYWPETWAVLDDNGVPVSWGEGTGRETCTQCGGCARYLPIEGDIGSDWGTCSHPKSQYDGTAVSEHWTCVYFDNGKRS